MLYLFLAVICASTYSILFKLFACRDVDSLQAIAFNYLTATLLGVLLSLGDMSGGLVLGWREWGLSAIMGVMFMVAFVLMARSTAVSGVAVTTVAARVALIIPVVLSYLFIERSVAPRWGAIAVIIVALVLVIWQPNQREKGESKGTSVLGTILLPALVFLLFGTNNFCLNWARSGLDAPGAAAQLSAAIFAFAALSSCAYYLIESKKRKFSWVALGGGVALGVANFFTTYFMILGLEMLPSGVFFPIYHVGIVALVATIGVVLFGERLSRVQLIGLAIAAVGIVAFFV